MDSTLLVIIPNEYLRYSCNVKMSNFTGVIDTLVADGEVVENFKPILQVMGYKLIPLSGTLERYRLLLSDGQRSYGYFILATQLNDRLLTGELDAFTVIRLDHYAKSTQYEGKSIILILNFTVLRQGSEIGQKLHNPGLSVATNDSGTPNNPGLSVATNDSGTPNNLGLSVATNDSDTPNKPDSTQKWSDAGRQHPVTGGESNSSPITTCNYNVKHDLTNTPYNNLAKRRMSRIESLTPYQNRWTIRARVTHKTPIKSWSNTRGTGRFFSIDLVDETGEIRALGWNDQVEDWYKNFEVNKVYYISNAYLKHTNKTYTNIKHDYEITLRSNTEIQVCNETCDSIPEMQYSFVPIASLANAVKDNLVDVIGICTSIGDMETIISRTNLQQYLKRDIVLVDQSNTAIRVTIWAEEAAKFEDVKHSVVAMKGAKVTDFGGIGLGAVMTSVIRINPDIIEAYTLRGWFEREGKGLQANYLSVNGGAANWKTFSQVFHEKLGLGSKPGYYTTKATVILMKKENCLYRSCPSENCKKKVMALESGDYYCEKCNKNSSDFRWSLILSVDLSDFSGNQRVTCFQETAEQILAKTSDEMGTLCEMDEDGFQQVFSEANFRTYIFKLRSKMETFNDENRVKTHVMAVLPMNYRSYCRWMLDELNV